MHVGGIMSKLFVASIVKGGVVSLFEFESEGTREIFIKKVEDADRGYNIGRVDLHNKNNDNYNECDDILLRSIYEMVTNPFNVSKYLDGRLLY